MGEKKITRRSILRPEERLKIVTDVEEYARQHGIGTEAAAEALGYTKTQYYANRLRVKGYSERGKAAAKRQGKKLKPNLGKKIGRPLGSKTKKPEDHVNGSDVAGVEHFPLSIIPERAPKPKPKPSRVIEVRPVDENKDMAASLLEVAARLLRR